MDAIKIQIKDVYGQEKIYPVNIAAQLFARIAGTKTLTRETMEAILALGYTVQVLDRYSQVCRSYNAGGPIDDDPNGYRNLAR